MASDLAFSEDFKANVGSWLSWKISFPWKKQCKPRSLGVIARASGDEALIHFRESYSKITVKDNAEDSIKPLKIKSSDFRAPKNPIVLCHGLSGFDRLILLPSMGQLTKILSNHSSSSNSDQFMEQDAEKSRLKGLLEVEYWFGVQQALEAKGCTVIPTRVPGFSSIQDRGQVLNECIEREARFLRYSRSPDEVYNSSQETRKTEGRQEPIKVNLIAHSMGGLDCRYMIHNLKNKNFDVLSLTTVSTPHHGSEMADFVVSLSRDMQKGIATDSKLKILPPAIYQLTTESMNAFNKTTPDDPNVKYMSYGASMQPKWYNLFFTSWNIVHDLSGGEPNDGLVSVKSSKWGEYLGTIQNADHLDIINWKNKLQKDFSRALVPNDLVKEKLEPEVNMLDFYLGIADDLARRGF
ncbi:LAME_0G02608g1_1 [Lachancea meyersii CBS 8951]|uniref:GPI inositol-deacylase n=1 Tax=Lachancea meyersii CBS 8951 TaxID=1266667 RepID=A0A1G4K639_9SACH|nr:LAME_0G02608g1_1 [Lachancea meyersii CBS 8951]